MHKIHNNAPKNMYNLSVIMVVVIIAVFGDCSGDDYIFEYTVLLGCRVVV